MLLGIGAVGPGRRASARVELPFASALDRVERFAAPRGAGRMAKRENEKMSEQLRDHSEFYGHKFEDLEVGMTAAVGRTVTDADILMFAGVSGDTNPVHLNGEFADSTMFAGRIAHGMLAASFISTVFGTRLPGPGCIYLAQSLRFKAPVRPGDTVVARVTVKELNPAKRRAVFDTVCTVAGKVVLDGQAEILVPQRG
jgi:3-hydroxybutyryl-CoA dehydratase